MQNRKEEESDMAIDIIYAGRVSEIGGAKAEGDNLWLSNADLTSASGWELKPHGACMGDVCIPIPPAHAPEFVRDSGREFNLAALARHLGQPSYTMTKTRCGISAKPPRRAALLLLRSKHLISSCPISMANCIDFPTIAARRCSSPHGPHGEDAAMTCQSGRAFTRS